MREISPLVIALEMFKKNISIYNSTHLVKNDSAVKIKQLSEIYRNSAYRSPLFCKMDSNPTIAFGWNKSRNCVVLFPNEGYFIRIYRQEQEYLGEYSRHVDMGELTEYGIFQLTLEYGISKVELSDELYEFIFGA